MRSPVPAHLFRTATYLLLLAATLATAQTSQTAAKRPMTFADLQAIKRISDPQISPSGKWVLFSVTDVSLEKNTKTSHLWVVPLKPETTSPNPERQLTSSDPGVGETNGRFSPDGRWVMYTSPGSTGTPQIVVAAWDDTHGNLADPKAHPVTALETGADGGLWAPDSQHFLFTSAVYPGCESHGPDRNEQEAACNARRDLEAAKNPVKAEIFTNLLYRHWNTYVGPKHSHIFLAALPAALGREQDPKPAAPTDLTPAIGEAEAPTFSLGGPLGYSISPDGKEIAYVTNLDPVPAASTNNDIFTLRLDDPNAKATKISTSPGSDDGPQYSPDGKYLAFRSQARPGYESDRFRLMLYDRAAKSTRELLPNFDRWIDEFVWAPSSAAIYFSSANAGEELIYKVSPEDSKPKRIAFLCEGCAGDWRPSEFGDLRIGSDSKTIIATRMSAKQPSEVVSLDANGIGGACSACVGSESRTARAKLPRPDADRLDASWRPITHLNDLLLSSLDLSAPEAFVFHGAEGALTEGFLLRPPNFDPNRKYPLKFLIHGGPQGAWGDAWSFRWNPELFAASGYVVVMINPRGSTGYGQKFIDEINGDWGGKPYIDLMRGLSYAEQHFPFIDKTRECALGASFGGFMANWILTHTNSQHPDRFACIVTHDGMFNPSSAYGATEELWFNEWEFRRPGSNEPGQPWRYAAGPIADDPFRKWSPMLSVQNAKTPTLVIHGQRDFRLDVSEGLQLFTALQRLGVPSEMLYFPDEGHWVLKPQNSQLWYKTVEDWCDRWTHTNHFAQPAAAQANSAQANSQR